GGGGFFLHAQRASRRLHLRGQRRQRRAAPSGLQLRRRSDPGRGVLLGAPGGDGVTRRIANGEWRIGNRERAKSRYSPITGFWLTTDSWRATRARRGSTSANRCARLLQNANSLAREFSSAASAAAARNGRLWTRSTAANTLISRTSCALVATRTTAPSTRS